MKRAIITGAGGFIGGALTRHLLDKGVVVYGIDISQKNMQEWLCHENFHPIVASFEEYNTLHEQITDDKIDVFFHFAWQGVFGKAFQNYELQLNNAKYAGLALEEAVKIGAHKFVFAGTMNEYEMDHYIKADYFEPRYTYIYSATKQVSEAICKTLAFNLGIEFSCGRIAMAYGERNKSMMLPNVVMTNLLNNRPCQLIEGNNLYDMIYIDDIVRAFELIGDRGKHMKSYYIGHRHMQTFRQLIEKIANILNPNCTLQFGAYPDVPSGIDYSEIDLNALFEDTGFECQADFKESILKTARWLKEEGICEK